MDGCKQNEDFKQTNKTKQTYTRNQERNKIAACLLASFLLVLRSIDRPTDQSPSTITDVPLLSKQGVSDQKRATKTPLIK